MAGILANSVSQTMTSGDTAVTKVVTGYLSQEQITFTTSPTGSTYLWGQSIPSGSAGARAALSSTTAASVRFTPDVAGTYLVTCTVDSVTDYTITISVLQSAITTSLETIRYAPILASQVVAPNLGSATFFDVTETALRQKLADGTLADFGVKVTTKSIDDTDSPYTVLKGDRLLLVDSLTAVVTVYLPTPLSMSGQIVLIKDSTGGAATNTITVDADTVGSSTIEGATTFLLTIDYQAAAFLSTGTKWLTV